MATPRYSIPELHSLIEQEESPLLVVEGYSDLRVLKWAFDLLDPPRNPLILDVNSIEINIYPVWKSDHTPGNRDYVTELARQLYGSDLESKVLCLIDADHDLINGNSKDSYTGNVALTDYPDIESYFASLVGITRYLKNICTIQRFKPGKHAANIISIPYSTYVLRKVLYPMSTYSGWSDTWSKSITSTSDGLGFDMHQCARKCLSGNNDAASEAVLFAKDIMLKHPQADHVVHGHDFITSLSLSAYQATGNKAYLDYDVIFNSIRTEVGPSILHESNLFNTLKSHFAF